MSEISSSAKEVTAVPGDSIAATGSFSGNAKENPAAPKTDNAFFDRFSFEAGFICDIFGSFIDVEPHLPPQGNVPALYFSSPCAWE
jgi:hypothetical protein